MAFAGPIEDRVFIHELVTTYADAVTRRDGDHWLIERRRYTILHIGAA